MRGRRGRLAPLALAVFAASTARAQSPPHLPPPPPPNSTPQYEPPPPPTQSPGSQQPPPRTTPRRERPERPEPQPREPSPPPRRYVPQPVERAEPVERDDAPRARTGFQLALRTGLSFPMGSVSGATIDGTSDALSNTFSTQIPFYLDVGAKLTPALFLGAYASFAFGATGSTFHDAQCPGSTRSCSAAEIRLGAEIQYHFQPSERLNPWIGYGLGLESSGASSTGGGVQVAETFTGFEFARLSGGVDYRISRMFGIGPFGDFSLGEYTHEHLEPLNQQVVDSSIPQKALHAWLTLGVRGVLFP